MLFNKCTDRQPIVWVCTSELHGGKGYWHLPLFTVSKDVWSLEGWGPCCLSGVFMGQVRTLPVCVMFAFLRVTQQCHGLRRTSTCI